jgi:hypothetical protein
MVIPINRLACGNCTLIEEDLNCPVNQHKRLKNSPSCAYIFGSYRDNGFEPNYGGTEWKSE